jgi:lipopolysaccharide transport system permease protein
VGPDAAITVIRPATGWKFPDLREAWAYNHLLYFLARRDVVIRYKQAIVGAFWAVIRPIVLATVFSVFLGLLAKVPSATDVPYPLFAVTGMVMWLTFTDALVAASDSTLGSQALLAKIYLPRILIPVAALAPSVVDWVFGLVIVLIVAAGFGFLPWIGVLAAPIALLLAMLTALGCGLWLSALNVKYRDITLLVPLVILVGMFISPVIYPFDLVPANVKPLYAINPMLGPLEIFRFAVLGTDWPGILLVIPTTITMIILVTGLLYYERAQRTFADLI